MTYSEWLDTLVSPINSFVSWLSLIADYLIHNYFVITLLGICLFISLVWLIFNLIFDSFDKINNYYDDYNDKFYNYSLSQKAKFDYLKKNRNELFDYLYDYKTLQYQVLNGIYQNQHDLLVDNKVHSLQINIDALKNLKESHLQDTNPDNDNDVDMIIPNPPVNLANKKELDNFERNDLFNSAYDYANSNFLNKHGIFIDKDSNNYIDSSTGEVLSFEDVQNRIHNDNNNYFVLSDSEKNRILQKDFEDYNSRDIFENDFVRESKDTFNEEFREGVYK